MMYFKAQVKNENNETKFRGGILSTSNEVEYNFDSDFGGELHTYDIENNNFETDVSIPDAECINRWKDKIDSGVWPIICINSETGCAYVLNEANVVDREHNTTIESSKTSIVLDPNVFPNGVSDILAIIK